MVALRVWLALCLLGGLGQAQAQPTVVIETALGPIEVVLEPEKAPLTVANFLRYVDAGMYDEGRFHRAVRLDNQVRTDAKIEVVQGGRSPERNKAQGGFGAIPLERTSVTGLKHLDGTISMARGNKPDSAVSDFFICINDQPSLDFGGARNPDGQGFAAFGRVVQGMDVVRRIQNAPSSTNRTTNTEAQRLTPPIKIIRVARLP